MQLKLIHDSDERAAVEAVLEQLEQTQLRADAVEIVERDSP